MSENGRLDQSELVEVHQPLTKHSYLAKAKGAAAANNTLWMLSQRNLKLDFYATGPASDYRTYDQQVTLWNDYQAGRGNLAARPGTSNHGLGLAKDVASRGMLLAINRWGSLVGCKKIEAPGEWWHFNFVGFSRPDPGLDIKNPIARRGAGGRAQAWYVKKVQRRLRAHGYKLSNDGEFGPATEELVKDFQRRKKLNADGVVAVKTWKALRSAPVSEDKPSDQPAPPPPKPPVNPLGEDAKIVAVLKRFGITRPKLCLQEARRARITVRIAASLLEQESRGGQNVWGGDPPPNGGTTGWNWRTVTKDDYLHYKDHRGPTGRGGMQGVGPCQLTWYSFQDEADRLGGCWRPRYNMRVGFGHLGQLIRQYGMQDGIRRYNGSGAAAHEYARTMVGRYNTWTQRLEEGGVKL